jgi:ElaB/YqjD/DUF883 family membrane-anchored ribosome-binding protein
MNRTAQDYRRATSDALASQLDNLIESASELLDNLNEQRSDAAETLRSRASQNIEGARRRLASMKRQMPESAAEAARLAAGFARENPWSTVAIGTLLVGSLAALLYMTLSDD